MLCALYAHVVDAGLDVNYQSKTRDPLFVHACFYGHANTVLYLAAETNADLDAVAVGYSDREGKYRHNCTGELMVVPLV